MTDGNICEACYLGSKNSLYGAVMTPYQCKVCNEHRLSPNTHIPGNCCETCSERLERCMECGSKSIISTNRQRVIDWVGT